MSVKRSVPPLLVLALAGFAHADFSTSTLSFLGVANGVTHGGGLTSFAQQSGAGEQTSVTGSQSFTGLDRNGDTQTMAFSATCTNSAQFGRLHSYTSGHLVNSYYNAANASYANGGGGIDDPSGSPDALASLGFSDFDDTLQFGGALQNGYKARYIFHIDGTNTGIGGLADLSVDIAGQNFAFFAGDLGYSAQDFATDDVEIDGQTPQQIHVQFSNQVVFNTPDLTDGGTYDGVSDFSSTATLAAIMVVDANGNPVSGVTVTSGSGTTYPTPEPASFAALGLGALGALRRRRRA